MTEDNSIQKPIKIMLLGDSNVGKTSLINRYTKNDFGASYITTIGIDFQLKILEIGDKKIRLQIWDTAGQEHFQTISQSYYKSSHGFILSYDTTNRRSFECINDWLISIKENANINIKIIIVGTKCDLENAKLVSKEEGRELAVKHGLSFFETSSLENINVTEAFECIATQIISSIEKGDLKERASMSMNLNEQRPEKEKKKCC